MILKKQKNISPAIFSSKHYNKNIKSELNLDAKNNPNENA